MLRGSECIKVLFIALRDLYILNEIWNASDNCGFQIAFIQF